MTNTPTEPAGAIHWHAGYNMPGYMPESDVDTYADIDDAISATIEVLRYHADTNESWNDEHDCDDIPCPTYGDDCPWDKARNLEGEAASLEANRAYVVQAGEFTIWAGDLVYWINPCTNDCDEARDAAWDAYPFDLFLAGYEECADGDSTPEVLVGEDRADDDHIIGWHASTMEAFRSDCLNFARDNTLDLVTSGLDARRAGMDFWLTRNRHGAGFWDEDYGKPSDVTAALGRLTDASHAYGSVDLYVGDDGWIYQA